MEKDVASRYQNANDLRRDLLRFKENKPKTKFSVKQTAWAKTFMPITAVLKPGPARLEIGLGGQRKDGQVISPFYVDVKYLGR